MSMTAALEDPNAGLEDITAEELRELRRIRQKAQGRQHTEYRKILVQRVQTRREDKKPPLPGGGYQSYRLAGGVHEHYKNEDVAEARRQSAEEMKKGLPPVSPQLTIYQTGDVITPQSDAEALMMDQDPRKFRPMGPDAAQSQTDELLAELARLRSENEALRGGAAGAPHPGQPTEEQKKNGKGR